MSIPDADRRPVTRTRGCRDPLRFAPSRPGSEGRCNGAPAACSGGEIEDGQRCVGRVRPHQTAPHAPVSLPPFPTISSRWRPVADPSQRAFVPNKEGLSVKRSIVLLPMLALMGGLVLVGSVGSDRRARRSTPRRLPRSRNGCSTAWPTSSSLRPATRSRPGSSRTTRRARTTGAVSRTQNNIKVNQNCLNVTDTDLQGRGQAQNETSLAIDPMPEEPHGRELQRLPARRRQLLRRPTASTAASAGATRTPPMSFTRGALYGAARAVLAGRRRHLGRLGHEGQRLSLVPDVPARSRRRRRTPTCRARSSSSARPGTPARRGTSRPGPWCRARRRTARTRRSSTSS